VRVLIVEDEPKMAALLQRGLEEAGFAADAVGHGEDALWRAQATPYDAIVLDIMLPGMDGVTVCRRLRNAGVWSPLLMLTARDAIDDRVSGLDAGADDYLVKPFALHELLARLRALLRRGAVARPVVLETGDLRLDPASRRAWRGERELDLTAKELQILEVFMRRPGEVLSRLDLLEHAGTTPTTTARTSSTCTCATCARRSSGRSAARRCRPCAARGTASWGRTTSCDGSRSERASPRHSP
jgi:two-component system OmpR family response regulator